MSSLSNVRKISVLMLALLLTVLQSSAPSVNAQATSGALRGLVTDSSGAVIVDATVTAKEAATGFEFKTATNSQGLYEFPRLKPGLYNLTVEKQGFKRAAFEQVSVIVAQTTAIDAVLQTGVVTETVTVTAGGEETVEKQQSQLSQTFESTKVSDLPSNLAGNGIDTLALLVPGVIPGVGNVNGNGTTLSVNGNRARANNFTIDGSDNNDITIGGPAFFVDNQDSVAEFQVVTNNYSAEYGRNQGAIVNIVTKSGTNQFHGDAFWFHRDRSFADSLNNIERRSGQNSPDRLLYNVYGGTFGGPIKKDKIFFFGSFESITDREGATLRSDNPTIAPEELGRLAAAFPNNPAVQVLAHDSAFAITDLGTVSERPDRPRNDTVTIGGQTFRVAFPQRVVPLRFTQYEFSGRGDYKINDKNTVWNHYTFQTVDNLNFLATSNGYTGNIPDRNQHETADWTWQVSNTAVNEVKFAFAKLRVTFGGGCGSLQGCIPDPAQIGNTFPQFTFTGLADSGGTNLQTIGPATNLPQGRIVKNYQFADNFSKVMGRHQLKMGADIRRINTEVPFLPDVNGSFRFGSATRLVNNSPSFVLLGLGNVNIKFDETDQFYYFQDDWRVRDNLILNLGVRYEYTGQPINSLNEQTVARESNASTAFFRQDLPLNVRTVPHVKADKTKWAPRVGFAYTPGFGHSGIAALILGPSKDSSVFRGGYSIAYDPSFYNLLLNVSTSSPAVFLTQTINSSTTSPVFPLPSGTLTGAAVQAFALSNKILAVNTFDPTFFTRTLMPTDLKSPMSQQWSFGWQRQLTHNQVIEARYVGTKGNRLFQTENGNPNIANLANGFTRVVDGKTINFPAFPQFLPTGVRPLVSPNNPATPDNEAAANGRVFLAGNVRIRDNSAQSIYHSLQVSYRGRIYNQLTLGVSYTFSKALDDASEVFQFDDNAVAQDPFNIGRAEKGFSTFDRRHVATVNFIWDVPFFKGEHGALGKALGGWQVGGIYYIGSGQRFTPQQFCNAGCLPVSYEDTAFQNAFFGTDNLRPFVGNLGAPRTSVGISQVDASLIFGVKVNDISGFYDFAALNNGHLVAVTKDQVRYIFNGPGAARIFGTPFGTAQRGSETGPIINQMNASVFKNFNVENFPGKRLFSNGVKIQLRLEVFNVFNHPNPGVGINAADATPTQFVEGVVATGSPFNQVSEQTFARRVVQVGAKFIF